MEQARILAKGQLVIPVKIRKKFGIKTGDAVMVFEYGGVIHVVPKSKDPVKDAIGVLPRKPSLAKQLLKDRAKE
jgi:AbrB family looped-hinge helix DNA binding protein